MKQRRPCPSGKRAYRDADTAARMAKVLSDLRLTVPQTSYRCPKCRAYHTTTVRERA